MGAAPFSVCSVHSVVSSKWLLGIKRIFHPVFPAGFGQRLEGALTIHLIQEDVATLVAAAHLSPVTTPE